MDEAIKIPCTRCSRLAGRPILKPLTDFRRDKTRPERHGRASWCNDCVREQRRTVGDVKPRYPEIVPFFRIWDVWPLFQPQDAQPKTKTFADLVRRSA